MAVKFYSSVSIALGLGVALSGCTTNSSGTTGVRLPSLSSARSVDPAMANACIISAANKYYLPTRVIRAVDSNKAVDGSTVVSLKVDIRDAVCNITKSGIVRSVNDTTPKSADQVAAEQQAANATNKNTVK